MTMENLFAFNLAWLVIPAAVALDLVLGDPHGWPHPVRWMGRAIEWFEPVCRGRWRNELIAGSFFATGLMAFTWVVSLCFVKTAFGLHPLLGSFAEIVMIYYCLSIRSLKDAAMEIFEILKAGKVDAARTKLSLIVGRDVEGYEAGDIARATVETVSENFVDGILSPLFFATIGGAPLCMAYKMVNTLDSMVGYKNDRYLRFGRSAARLDDAANFIPARLSVIAICAAAGCLSSRCGRRCFKTARSEGRRHSSPNAGYPEAAFAGALGLRLGGPNYYHGRLVEKPFIGSRFGSAVSHHIIEACHLMMVAALLSAAVAWLSDALIRWV